MSKDIKFLTATVYCKNCNTKLYQSSILVNYEGHISIKHFNKEVINKTPNNIVCKKCNEVENEKGYAFYHHQKISN